MEVITHQSDEMGGNPLDILEQIVVAELWPHDRAADEELHVTATGGWCDYHLTFSWRPDLEALHVAVAFDVKVPVEKLGAVHQLLALVNEQLWIGHFDLWSEDRLVMFRYGALLNGGAPFTPEQAESLLRLAVEACERFYPAFQFVIWAGKSAREAVEACMFETEGEA
ncbi:MAG: YbjN domain-containing protein [Alphaproteobacteria bacterium]|nr:YbjN domain-containing protein [Alphaproteobacteria bacterium]